MHIPDIGPLGDKAVRVNFGTEISEEIHLQVRAFCRLLESENITGVSEWVPAYTTVTVHYEPLECSYPSLKQELQQLTEKMKEISLTPGPVWKLPVCYGGEFGPDLKEAAAYTGLSEEEIIQRHTSACYTVYMMGFTPGFPYLGGMDKSIAVPRLETPRNAVPAGAVGIAGEQTGVYSLKTPGGWRIIGRTPVKLCDREAEVPVFLKAGDRIQFTAVTKEEFETIEKKIAEGTYELVQEGSA
ncbi:5-oxoprolinase subunit PxpB [Alkalicoccus daliensis]|uniref:Inhibitor of KinA n=1 Tax=Alkalicoccus daliensis TaxID=745820 RepID=A0A1H0J588_9BACI|nr:5-oxoprolinase subunit PxpB [Alkalicoccus daliensis]SDO38531.1 inhibitor of KinA [Alkalicoccus daliensis]